MQVFNNKLQDSLNVAFQQAQEFNKNRAAAEEEGVRKFWRLKQTFKLQKEQIVKPDYKIL